VRGWRGACLLLATLAAAPAAAEPPAGDTAPAGLQSFARATLPNGLRFQLARPRSTALFSEVLLVARAGTGIAPGEEVAQVAAQALTCGRLAADGPPLRLQLARLGVTLDFTVGPEVAVFRFAVPTRNTMPLLKLLADVLSRPSLPEETWQEALALRGGSLAQEEADVWQSATAQLTHLAWGERTAPPASPAPPVVAPLDPAALAGFRARSYAPGQLVLSVWGELPVDEVEAAVRRDFGTLAPGGGAAPRLGRPGEPVRRVGGGMRCLQEEGAVPPALLVGAGVEAGGDLAFYGWQLLAHILGASNNSRLQGRLRSESQVVYTVEATCVPVGTQGLILRIACQTDQVKATRKIILDELRRLTAEPVTEGELNLARAILRSRLQLDQVTFRDQFFRRSLAWLGVPGVREPASAEPVLRDITPASLLALAQRTLHPEDVATVVVSAHAEPVCEVEHEPKTR
jgi:predicted Zn-dependent peptidase